VGLAKLQSPPAITARVGTPGSISCFSAIETRRKRVGMLESPQAEVYPMQRNPSRMHRIVCGRARSLSCLQLWATVPACMRAMTIEDSWPQLIRNIRRAIKINDAATMTRILADDFILVTGSGKTYSKSDLLKEARSGQIRYEHQEETQQAVHIWGNTAVVTAKLWLNGTNAGVPFDKTVWFSDTYVRTPDGWRYVVGQSSCACQQMCHPSLWLRWVLGPVRIQKPGLAPLRTRNPLSISAELVGRVHEKQVRNCDGHCWRYLARGIPLCDQLSRLNKSGPNFLLTDFPVIAYSFCADVRTRFSQFIYVRNHLYSGQRIGRGDPVPSY
jgi:ketosteroid isomerase-like protein